MRPPAQAKLADLRPTENSARLDEQPCDRPPDTTEILIAAAYVNAISGGAARTVLGAVDYDSLGCDADAVGQNKKCQTAVFNGQDGKTVLMNAITPPTGGDWRTTNIKSLYIPEEAMRRIGTDPRYAKTKALFNAMATPGNGLFEKTEKLRQTKEVLKQYMASIH